jgi:hypothetical protein
MGLVALGGLAIALCIAFGGGAIAPIAVGGCAIGFVSIGGLAIGYYAHGCCFGCSCDKCYGSKSRSG